jgi:outer membrane protein TolC
MTLEDRIVEEVQEAFYRYEKALVQVDSGLDKIRLREREVEVVRAKAAVDQALTSEVMDALVRLADQRTTYVEALKDYYDALADLNHAIGFRVFRY